MKDSKKYVVPASDHYYCEIVEGEYNEKEKVLRITYVSDGPSYEDVHEYIQERFKSLSVDKIQRIYSDRPWHFTKTGVPYAVILVFFKD